MTVSSATSAGLAPETNSSIGKLNADFDMFLKLLTAQMQNQDPLDPMDTAQYTEQLVQYSQVEQAIEQTATLKEMLAGMGSQDLLQASALVGSTVEYDSPDAALGDAPAAWSWSADRTPAKLVATLTDASGRTVETRAIDPAASGQLAWDGTLTNGGTAPAGTYTLSLKAEDTSGNAIPVAIHGIGTVSDARGGNGGTTVGINGLQVPVGKLVRIGGG